MIERLSKVIHWVGFLVFIASYLYIIYEILNYEFKFNSNVFDIYTILIVFIIGVIPFIICWIFQYILSGNSSILPSSDRDFKDLCRILFLNIPIIFGVWFGFRFIFASLF